ncbi:hypothetical protein JSO61_000045 [Riemerella anatipestifer]|uniref:hypothetical protein n=1 Tax=Riemerella anatipestifer TaxID=34085 RepID=UPI002A8CDD1C|nr:hypothetical protein [Riemerella anatipestifer]MDY3520868.1 hypothetical protein [Riemerella anatipestifer]MDY3533109.1 hypothetical protein [Riemerella anatipestifer]MDY3535582.1 hypothetical protein [Riemerella anatipestifer]
MKLKMIISFALTILLTSCIKVWNQMGELQPLENYSTQNTVIKDKNVMDAKITFINDKDINGKIRGEKNIIYGFLNETSINKFFPIYDNTGKKEYISFNLIKEMTINDYKGNQRKFVNRGAGYKSLHEVFYDGRKIKWFREYYNNAYDGSVQVIDHIINEKNEEVHVGLLNSMKNKLKEITSSKPELATKIDNFKKLDKEIIIQIFEEYEK